VITVSSVSRSARWAPSFSVRRHNARERMEAERPGCGILSDVLKTYMEVVLTGC
jgi:hypothetical protein